MASPRDHCCIAAYGKNSVTIDSRGQMLETLKHIGSAKQWGGKVLDDGKCQQQHRSEPSPGAFSQVRCCRSSVRGQELRWKLLIDAELPGKNSEDKRRGGGGDSA